MRSRLVLLASLALIAAACSRSAGSSVAPVALNEASGATGADLTIFAAASLGTVLDEVRLAYAAAAPGTTLTVSTDSSAALATQISEGAPADVFLSADATNPQKLVEAGLVHGDPIPFAGNALTVITPAANPGALTTPFDLGTPGVRVIAAGDEVPITKYATELIDNLAAASDAPADFAAAYAANVASREDNVAAVRTKIELGEGDAAIVYVTDAAGSDEVATIDIPDAANVAATYAGVVVKASPDLEAAHGFLDWIAGPDGGAILARFGFLPPAS
jgi:molybdate transport system substrate-binding protein